MTSGKADRLKQLASDLRCAKCETRPRLGNSSRCRECLRVADTEREIAARPRLLAGGSKSNRQPAAVSRAATRKPLATAPTAPSKALTVATRPAVPAFVTHVAAEPVRELGKPYTLAQWQVLITQTLKRWRTAGTVAQNRMAEGSLAAKTIAENTAFGRVTYGPNASVFLKPPSNAAASLLHWALERAGVRFDLVDVHGDLADTRTVCPHCDAKVRQPCNESRARNCANRSRGNR